MKNKKSREELLQYYLGLPYTIKITPEEVGGYFVEIEEFEGCMSQGETIEEVMRNIKEAQEGWLEVAIEEELEIPLPKVMEEYSGKFVLRVPKSLHGKLSNLAEREGVSLNQMIVSLLSERFSLRKVEGMFQSLSWLVERMQKGLYDLKKEFSPLSNEAKKIQGERATFQIKSLKGKRPTIYEYKRVL